MDPKILKLLLRKGALKARTLTRTHRQTGPDLIRDAATTQRVHAKRALLCYMADAFTYDRDDPRLWTHPSLGRTRMLGTILADRGYHVDALRHTADGEQVDSHYDLVVGLGPAMLSLPESIMKSATTIFILSGTVPSQNNKNERERLANLKERRGVSLKPRRLSQWDERRLSEFSAVAYLGNDWTRKGVAPHNTSLFPFPNHHAGSPLSHDRESATQGSGFLYLASGGQVHRGLDLLLEAFAQTPHAHLHICAPLHDELDFVWHYRRELFRTRNIHAWGWVRTDSRMFNNICNACSHVILPSCAEGQPGSITMGMHRGLIPIVSRECGLDLHGVGEQLETCTVASLIAKINQAFANPDNTDTTSKRVREMASKYYSQTAFTKHWNNILGNLTGDTGECAV
jgi:glycosyltransferase involved in cell wall biosynthesis